MSGSNVWIPTFVSFHQRRAGPGTLNKHRRRPIICNRSAITSEIASANDRPILRIFHLITSITRAGVIKFQTRAVRSPEVAPHFFFFFHSFSSSFYLFFFCTDSEKFNLVLLPMRRILSRCNTPCRLSTGRNFIAIFRTFETLGLSLFYLLTVSKRFSAE